MTPDVLRRGARVFGSKQCSVEPNSGVTVDLRNLGESGSDYRMVEVISNGSPNGND